jgi:agmatine/peptidylarginine deiminase
MCPVSSPGSEGIIKSSSIPSFFLRISLISYSKKCSLSVIITLLENDVPVQIYSVQKNMLPSIRKKFPPTKNLLITYTTDIAKLADIWIRDFGPGFMNTENEIKPFRFIYQPSYATSTAEIHWFERNNEAGKKLTIKVPEDIELILDGGTLSITVLELLL